TAATPHQPWSTPPPDTSSTGTGERERGRRTGTVLVVGVIAVALAVAGLTYGLLNHDDGDKGRSGGVTDSASGVVSSPATQSETSAEAESPSPSPSPSASSEAPEQTVSVTVTGAHTEYSGACPPSDSEAPAFTATITVGQLPATVSYRWVSKDGELSGQTWKTLEFPSDGGKSKQDKVILSTYAETGTYENAIAVEVRDPVKKTSGSVPFSVTCETQESPSGEASPSPSPSE
ncbi:serine/threonine protein kinase, partial [Streptomyces sp. NPDC002491]